MHPSIATYRSKTTNRQVMIGRTKPQQGYRIESVFVGVDEQDDGTRDRDVR